jgi:sigma-E factor negative regulatory protein RseA
MTNFEHNTLSEQELQQEKLSALHDGQLSSQEALALVRASLADDSLMLQWRSMSAIGQVLREEGGQPTWRNSRAEASQLSKVTQPTVHSTAHAANENRWKMIAGFAALAAVGSLVWGLLGATGGNALQQGAVLASNQNSVTNPAATLVGASTGQASNPIAGQEVTMIRNPRLDEFLAAHKQFGGVSALQQPAGSLRSVSVTTSRP